VLKKSVSAWKDSLSGFTGCGKMMIAA